MSAPSCPGKESDFGQSCERESQCDQEVEGDTGGSVVLRDEEELSCVRKRPVFAIYMEGFLPKDVA